MCNPTRASFERPCVQVRPRHHCSQFTLRMRCKRRADLLENGGDETTIRTMGAAERNNVTVDGLADGRPIMFAHGFGCDQVMWRFVAPDFENDHQVVLFDHVGCGGSDASAFDPQKYSSLDGYAADVLAIIDQHDLRNVVFVGHSVSAMIGVLASIERPELFDALVLIGPSPRYVDGDDYAGGFAPDDIDELLSSLDSNYLGWS